MELTRRLSRREVLASSVIASKLLWNGLRFRLLRLTGRPGRPQAVSLEVTHSCVARCVMCNIWKMPQSVPDLPLTAWVDLLSELRLRDLRELDVTGGEPFMRDDLAALLLAVSGLKPMRLKQLRSVAVTTNGILTERVVGTVGEVLEPMRQSGLDLVVVCALDAVGSLHDRIRRYEGAWERVDRTIAGLIELREAHRNLIVGLKTTVLPQNVGELEALAAYARDRDLFTIISPAIVTAGRYLNTDKAADLTLSADARARLAQFYQGSDHRWSYHAGAVSRYLQSGRMHKPCTSGFNYFFVRSNGDLFLCPLFAEAVGNVTEESLDRLLTSDRARAARRRIGRAAECTRCTEPGLERYSLPYDGFAYLRTLLALGPRGFLDLRRHLGLDKYV